MSLSTKNWARHLNFNIKIEPEHHLYDAVCVAIEMANLMGGSISGSILTNNATAQDVDVFVGVSAFTNFLNKKGLDMYDTEITFRDVVYSRKQWDDCDQYQESNKDDALVCTWRGYPFNVNIIVISDLFIAAFEASRLEMLRRPELYQDRDARIKLHHDFRNTIRQMMEPVRDANDNLPV
ncbi:hypothetical protein HOR97_gp14 [Agrobacterium phage Atu_ph03]|uniref:Uncharacterized protein n=1 Tax=Agrobacterium phage Atu_ph03 TaxID=2024262 RepID=A0A2L0UZ10_9CAUD|nr:hypothetical protein HOR97_gp14 [Agrobacterium phage Atu_ph03]AUZ94775.1 hypothetical protein [Agrobacterium phage Atu_ph03]